MEKGILVVNQKLQVELKSGNYAGKYSSRIEDASDTSISISAPTYQGGLVPLNPGMTIGCVITTEGSLYIFQSVILEKKLEPIPVLIIKMPENMQKIQRRSFFRLRVSLPVLWRVVPSLTSPSFDEFNKTICNDISGGGLLLIMASPPPKDTLIEVLLDLPKLGTISSIVRVAFIKESPDKKTTEIATEFVIIEEPEREKVIKFIFDQQREQRKKEMLKGM